MIDLPPSLLLLFDEVKVSALGRYIENKMNSDEGFINKIVLERVQLVV